MKQEVTIRRLTAENVYAALPGLAALLVDCVDGGASVSFLQPMTAAKSMAFWCEVADDVSRGRRAVLVAEDDEGMVLGSAQLVLALPENQPHRADVAKLLVHRYVRGRGVARQLMQAVESAARDERRTLLVLDTVTGGDGDRLYTAAGWHRVGDVPGYALMPDGRPCSTTFFYKPVTKQVTPASPPGQETVVP